MATCVGITRSFLRIEPRVSAVAGLGNARLGCARFGTVRLRREPFALAGRLKRGASARGSGTGHSSPFQEREAELGEGNER